MTVRWTARGRNRFAACSDYIAQTFHPGYADAWEDDVAETVERISGTPLLGREAFPELKRSELRKILFHNHRYWLYYRVGKTGIDILSIRHTLMNVDSPCRL